jgi:hypothetical protein
MHDVSPSGAFIVTHVFLPLHARVEIELHPGCRPDGSRGCRLSAFVVRNAPAGVGVEWCEFSPRGVQELGGTSPGKSLVPRRRARAAGPLSARERSCSDVC